MADMVEGMFGDGAPVAAVVRAIRAIELSVFVRGQSADSADTKRTKDRERKREKRKIARENKGDAEANDAAIDPPVSADNADMSADSADKRCDSILTSSSLFPEKEGIQEVSKKEKKKEVAARARGTRLTQTAELSAEDEQFAREHGIADPIAAWAEFIDYWISVPGQRGTKLDWSATWRNRVRMVSTKHGGKHGKLSLADTADDLIARAKERERETDPGHAEDADFGGIRDGKTLDGTVSTPSAGRT